MMNENLKSIIFSKCCAIQMPYSLPGHRPVLISDAALLALLYLTGLTRSSLLYLTPLRRAPLHPSLTCPAAAAARSISQLPALPRSTTPRRPRSIATRSAPLYHAGRGPACPASLATHRPSRRLALTRHASCHLPRASASAGLRRPGMPRASPGGVLPLLLAQGDQAGGVLGQRKPLPVQERGELQEECMACSSRRLCRRKEPREKATAPRENAADAAPRKKSAAPRD